MAHVGKRGFMACATAVSRGGAYYFPSDLDRAEHPKLQNQIWKGRKSETLPQLLGHGTDVVAALGIAMDGKAQASIFGKTGQGHYGFAVNRKVDAKGRFDLQATLRETWDRAAIGGYNRDLAKFSE